MKSANSYMKTNTLTIFEKKPNKAINTARYTRLDAQKAVRQLS